MEKTYNMVEHFRSVEAANGHSGYFYSVGGDAGNSYWMLPLLKLVKPESPNRCFIERAASLVPSGMEGLTVSFGGKAARSTGKMSGHKAALQIAGAHMAQPGMTFGQAKVDGESNEIPAVRELVRMLDLKAAWPWRTPPTAKGKRRGRRWKAAPTAY